MKYIRTKDGKIINVSDNWEAHYSKKDDEYVLESYTANWNVLMGVLAEDIIEQADTVEELCDLFAFEDTFDIKHLAPEFFSSMALARLWAKKSGLIGYIIVEKNGAKAIEPVAKTNDIGKFELLYE